MYGIYYDYIHMVEYKNKAIIQAESVFVTGDASCDICKRVPRTLHPLNVLFLKQRVDRLSGARELGQHAPHQSPTFLMSGILGANLCEICEMTSCIKGWFFIVLRAFMMLYDK